MGCDLWILLVSVVLVVSFAAGCQFAWWVRGDY